MDKTKKRKQPIAYGSSIQIDGVPFPLKWTVRLKETKKGTRLQMRTKIFTSDMVLSEPERILLNVLAHQQ